MLVACGGPLEAGPPAADEPLARVEGALCAGLSVTSLTLLGVSTYEGVMAGSGSWTVSSPANAVRMEYYVDGSLRSYETRTGTSGNWYFSVGGIACGSHPFEVRAYPMVIDSQNNSTTCVDGSRSLSQSVSGSCAAATASVSCVRMTSMFMQCTGSASGGNGTLIPYWQLETDGVPGAWQQGTAWTRKLVCEMPTLGSPTRLARQHFKVIDSAGIESAVASSPAYVCGSSF